MLDGRETTKTSRRQIPSCLVSLRHRRLRPAIDETFGCPIHQAFFARWVGYQEAQLAGTSFVSYQGACLLAPQARPFQRWASSPFVLLALFASSQPFSAARSLRLPSSCVLTNSQRYSPKKCSLLNRAFPRNSPHNEKNHLPSGGWVIWVENSSLN